MQTAWCRSTIIFPSSSESDLRYCLLRFISNFQVTIGESRKVNITKTQFTYEIKIILNQLLIADLGQTRKGVGLQHSPDTSCTPCPC